MDCRGGIELRGAISERSEADVGGNVEAGPADAIADCWRVSNAKEESEKEGGFNSNPKPERMNGKGLPLGGASPRTMPAAIKEPITWAKT